MHDEQGPRRLRQGNDTPEALLRAIDALRKGVDDSARLSRVGQKLDGVLNAAPNAAASAAQQTGLFGQKLSSLKLILGGLALLVALTPLLFRQHSDDGAVPGAERDGSPAAPASATPVAPAEVPAVAEVAQPQPLENNVAAPAPSPARRAAKHASRQRSHEPPAANGESTVARTEAPEAPAAATTRAVSPGPATEPAEAEAPKEPQRRPAAKAEPPREAPAAPAEADLLLQARKALKLDPSRALSLAAEHQSYYPKGRLVPEREVLAIEALRSLGRKQEADERLKQFEARYPKSIHLQRLHEGL